MVEAEWRKEDGRVIACGLRGSVTSPEFENITPPLSEYVGAKDCKNEGWSSLKDWRVHGMVVRRANHNDPDTHGGQSAQGTHLQRGASHTTGLGSSCISVMPLHIERISTAEATPHRAPANQPRAGWERNVLLWVAFRHFIVCR
jgi:hypothetical protein